MANNFICELRLIQLVYAIRFNSCSFLSCLPVYILNILYPLSVLTVMSSLFIISGSSGANLVLENLGTRTECWDDKQDLRLEKLKVIHRRGW